MTLFNAHLHPTPFFDRCIVCLERWGWILMALAFIAFTALAVMGGMGLFGLL
ncbi:hypothetical protein [Magnetofaba australis]|uniref:hypothetical protein n=1 Tax=Magnetofaba australis TaxID=1472297 RepID=UPI0013019FB8|nr:hypothetical protein [Magnetofaba australis]